MDNILNAAQLSVLIKFLTDTKGIDDAAAKLTTFQGAAQEAGKIAATAFAAAGAAFIAFTAYSVKAAANWDEFTKNIQGNTGMTNAELDTMKQSVMALGSQSGESLNDLANGFMHIYDEGYSAADSTKILQAAMEGALVTGSNVTDVAKSLSLIMTDFGANANQAGDYMAKLQTIAQHGNLTLQDLSTNFSILAGVAHGVGISLNDVGAAYDNVTQTTGDASEAQTQVKELILSLSAPTSATKKEIDALSGGMGGLSSASKVTASSLELANNKLTIAKDKLAALSPSVKDYKDKLLSAQDSVLSTTASLDKLNSKASAGTKVMAEAGAKGIDLAYDFSAAGLKAKGFGGVMDDVAKATNGNISELKALFPNVRAFEGALTILSDKGKSYRDELKHIQDANGETLKKEYTDRLNDFNTAWARVKTNVQIVAIAYGDVLLPAFTSVVNYIASAIVPAAKTLSDWWKEHQKQIMAVANVIWNNLIVAFQFIWFTIQLAFIPVLKQLQQLWQDHHHAIILIAEVVGVALVAAIAGAIIVIGVLIQIVIGATNAILSFGNWAKNTLFDIGKATVTFGSVWQGLGALFMDVLKVMGDGFKSWVNSLIDGFNTIIKGIDSIGKAGGKGGLNIPTIPHFAGGVTNFGGGMAMLGENGPELAYLPQGTNVYTNSQTQQIMNNDKGATIVNYNTFNTPAAPQQLLARINYSLATIRG
jgi:minor tail protein